MAHETTSAQKLILLALKSLGKLAAGESPRPELQSDAFDILHELLDSWKTQKLLVPHLVRHELVLTGANTYTVGPGGAVDMALPFDLVYAFVLDSASNVKREIPVLNQDALANRAQDVITPAYAVSHAYYTPGAPTGTLTIPADVSGDTVALYFLTGLPAFEDLVTEYALMPGYALALRTNLAKALAPFYGVQWTRELDDAARTSLGDVKRLNIKHGVLVNYFAPGGARYNIRTDEFHR